MAKTPSPLRYPGGKSALVKMVGGILRANGLDRGHYAEPFAGGAGLALSLLFKGDVGEIHLNDVDPAIASLWRSILNQPQELTELIHTTALTVEERDRQRAIYLSGCADELKLGFSALYLNRVNRSGIIKTGGVIGGLSQSGTYKIDCRFNKPEIASRIKRISRYANRIHFTSMDGAAFVRQVDSRLPRRSLIYADPPYYSKGSELYTSAFKHEDHAAFRDAIADIKTRWFATYDDHPVIREIYKKHRQFTFDINYSAQTKRVGSELLIAGSWMVIPPSLRSNLVHRPQSQAPKPAATPQLEHCPISFPA